MTEVPGGIGPTVLTIGVFDGVHRGHQKVISQTVRRARELSATAVVLTFDPHPMAVLRPTKAPALLATLDHRLELFGEYGADAALVLPFSSDRSRQSAEDFAREIAGALNPASIVVGSDFRFGFKAAGDVDLLRRLGEELGFSVEALDRDESDPEWSSSAIRKRLLSGDVQTANELLGHRFQIEGTVVAGSDRGGRVLGFPTANVPISEQFAVPADGVYAGRLRRQQDPPDRWLPNAISVGTNPQFGEEPRRVESYVLDADLELYDVPVVVEFVSRLREQQVFESVDDLTAQMHRDVQQVRELIRSTD